MPTCTPDVKTFRVLYADDHELMRSAVGTLIDSHPQLDLAGAAANGAELASTYQRLYEAGERPDLVVTDLAMPEMDGVEACGRICAIDPNAVIVVLSAYDDAARVTAALGAGATSYLLKSSSADNLVASIVRCAQGSVVFNQDALASLVGTLNEERAVRDRVSGLTERQIEVLRLTDAGYSRAQIGEQLYISASTVKTHLACVYERLGVSNARQAAHLAREAGIL